MRATQTDATNRTWGVAGREEWRKRMKNATKFRKVLINRSQTRLTKRRRCYRIDWLCVCVYVSRSIVRTYCVRNRSSVGKEERTEGVVNATMISKPLFLGCENRCPLWCDGFLSAPWVCVCIRKFPLQISAQLLTFRGVGGPVCVRWG